MIDIPPLDGPTLLFVVGPSGAHPHLVTGHGSHRAGCATTVVSGGCDGLTR